MNEFKRQAWVARDKSGDLWIYGDDKPHKRSADEWADEWTSDGTLMEQLDNALFPSVKWEDAEPTEVEITIKLKGGEKNETIDRRKGTH